MSFVSKLIEIRDYIDNLRINSGSGLSVFGHNLLSKPEFFDIYDILWDLLEELLTVFGNVVISGQPYPPDKLSCSTERTDEVIDVGDGTAGPYSGTLTNVPIDESLLEITATDENDITLSVVDDGNGNLIGDVDIGETNTINYTTGAWQCTFSANVKNTENITADYYSQNVTASDVDLTWDKAIGNVDGQRLYRKTGVAGEYAQVGSDLAANATSYTDATVAAATTYFYKVIGFNNVAAPQEKSISWQLNNHLSVAFPEDITAGITDITIYIPALNGKILEAGFYLDETGADGTDALQLEMDMKIGGVSIFDTKPAITKAAADKSSTFAAGTGITVGAVAADQEYSIGGLITISLSLTRTTPETEMAGCIITLVVDEGDTSESADSNELEVTTLAA